MLCLSDRCCSSPGSIFFSFMWSFRVECIFFLGMFDLKTYVFRIQMSLPLALIAATNDSVNSEKIYCVFILLFRRLSHIKHMRSVEKFFFFFISWCADVRMEKKKWNIAHSARASTCFTLYWPDYSLKLYTHIGSTTVGTGVKILASFFRLQTPWIYWRFFPP